MPEEDSTSMNKELQDWIRESRDKIKDLETQQKDVKKPSGKCELCGERTAIAVCLKCGKSVCKSCYFKLIGICKKCVPPEIAAKWDGSQPDWEKELGVDWVG